MATAQSVFPISMISIIQSVALVLLVVLVTSIEQPLSALCRIHGDDRTIAVFD